MTTICRVPEKEPTEKDPTKRDSTQDVSSILNTCSFTASSSPGSLPLPMRRGRCRLSAESRHRRESDDDLEGRGRWRPPKSLTAIRA